MIQIITVKNLDNNDENILITNFSEVRSFDEFDLNIIDLNDVRVWENDGSSPHDINLFDDLNRIGENLNDAKTSKTLIILPQNYRMNYDYGTINRDIYVSQGYKKHIELRDNIDVMIGIIEDCFGLIEIDLVNEITDTKINNIKFASNFSFRDSPIYIPLTNSVRSKKNTTVEINNVILTSLNLLYIEDYITLYDFLFNKEEEIPEWFADIKFFNDEDLLKQKDENLKMISEIKQKNNEIQKQLRDNNLLKSILYESGKNLEELVKSILDNIFGIDNDKFIDRKKEDFLYLYNDIYYIGEIKGVNTNIRSENVGQTLKHLLSFLDDNDYSVKAKGILIINYQRKLPLSERRKVHDEQISFSELNSILIIPTHTLLKIYEDYLNKNISKGEIIYLLTNEKGLLNYKG